MTQKWTDTYLIWRWICILFFILTLHCSSEWLKPLENGIYIFFLNITYKFRWKGLHFQWKWFILVFKTMGPNSTLSYNQWVPYSKINKLMKSNLWVLAKFYEFQIRDSLQNESLKGQCRTQNQYYRNAPGVHWCTSRDTVWHLPIKNVTDTHCVCQFF